MHALSSGPRLRWAFFLVVVCATLSLARDGTGSDSSAVKTVVAGPGLAGGGTGKTVEVHVATGGITLPMISEQAKNAMQGNTGQRGPVGPAGPAGATGPQGPAGPSGGGGGSATYRYLTFENATDHVLTDPRLVNAYGAPTLGPGLERTTSTSVVITAPSVIKIHLAGRRSIDSWNIDPDLFTPDFNYHDSGLYFMRATVLDSSNSLVYDTYGGYFQNAPPGDDYFAVPVQAGVYTISAGLECPLDISMWDGASNTNINFPPSNTYVSRHSFAEVEVKTIS